MESDVFGWSRSRIPNNTESRSRIFFVQLRLRIPSLIRGCWKDLFQGGH